MRIGSVSARYAGALFDLAKEKGLLERIQRDVEFLGDEVAEPSVASFLVDARVPLEEKRKRLAFLQGHVHALTYNFVQLLIDRRRIDVLPEIATAFHRRALIERGAVEGVVESARPLDPAQVESLRATLQARLGKEVLLRPRAVPELVGGVRVMVDNRMIDQSVQGRLAGLEQKLKSVPLTGA